MESKNSIKMYNYEELNGLDITERSLSIKGISSNEIIAFTTKEITQFKGNYEKGYFIIEGKMKDLSTYVKAGKVQEAKDLDRKVNIKWNHGGKVKEISFVGRCICYSEHYDNNNHGYFEIVIQETQAIKLNAKFLRVKDYYLYVEIGKNSVKNISKWDVFWAETGIVLGAATVIGGASVIIMGGASVLVGVTIIYGINTIASCTYDMAMVFSGDKEKMGSFNLIRDHVFANAADLVGDRLRWSSSKKESWGKGSYLTSEIILSYKGIKALSKQLIKGWKLKEQYYVTGKILKAKIYGGAPQDMGVRTINYSRFGHDVYQLVNSYHCGKGYVIQLGQEIKELSKTISTNPSAIEVSN